MRDRRIMDSLESNSNPIEYVESVLKKDKYTDKAEEFYFGNSSMDPVKLLREYSKEIEASFPENLDEEKIRDRSRKGYASFEEALDIIATGKLVE